MEEYRVSKELIEKTLLCLANTPTGKYTYVEVHSLIQAFQQVTVIEETKEKPKENALKEDEFKDVIS